MVIRIARAPEGPTHLTSHMCAIDCEYLEMFAIGVPHVWTFSNAFPVKVDRAGAEGNGATAESRGRNGHLVTAPHTDLYEPDSRIRR
jgi:hypothetical protein